MKIGSINDYKIFMSNIEKALPAAFCSSEESRLVFFLFYARRPMAWGGDNMEQLYEKWTKIYLNLHLKCERAHVVDVRIDGTKTNSWRLKNRSRAAGKMRRQAEGILVQQAREIY